MTCPMGGLCCRCSPCSYLQPQAETDELSAVVDALRAEGVGAVLVRERAACCGPKCLRPEGDCVSHTYGRGVLARLREAGFTVVNVDALPEGGTDDAPLL
jgi:hypothetical protein